jgi:uncharacterized delta-60 repeat protein
MAELVPSIRTRYPGKTIMNSRFKLALLCISLSLLSACGGGSSDTPNPPGGSGTPSSPAAPTPPAAQPAFTLSLDADKAVVFQGATAAVRASVTRQGGFTGAVSVQLTGLPPGVSASPAVIAEGASAVQLTLAANAEAPHSLPTAAGVEGSAMINAATQRSAQALNVTVRGRAGMADTSFAGGSFLTRVGTSEDYAQAVAVQADGKVLVAGSTSTTAGIQIAVVRYLRDGGTDTSFGTDGRATVAVGTRDDKAMAIAVQPDGKIVVAGLSNQGATSGYDFALVRLLANGAVDSGFGNSGRVVTDFGGDNDRAFALLLMPDGSIVAAGQTNRTGVTGLDFALARYAADGRPDATFGAGGQVVTAALPGSTGDVIRGLALQTVNGQPYILAVGGEGDFTAARYTPTGALDSGFGTGGKLSGLFGVSIGSAYAVTVLPSGEAVLAGHVGHDFAAVKLSASGQLDPTFGPARDGRFRHSMASNNWDEATAVVRQADGKLILGGWAYTGVGTSGDFAALRLNADGTLDTGFGNGGTVQRAVADNGKTDLGRALVLQVDERIPTVRALLAGEAQDINRDFALLRLWL